MVNIDFFKDLMQVLKDLITRLPDGDESQRADPESNKHPYGDPTIRHKLLCIVTAFELLSGQGETFIFASATF